MTLTPLAAFRLELGDTDAARQLFSDVEAQYYLDQRSGDVLLAVADACDALARRFSREHDFEWQGSNTARGKFSRSQMAKAYAEQAKALRKRANGQLSTASTSRVDGFSEDIDSRQGAGQGSPSSGRVLAGYRNPDFTD
jgi:hypothetical protein